VLECKDGYIQHCTSGASEPPALALEEARGTHAPGPGQRKPRTPPTDASHAAAAGRIGGGRRPAAHAAAAPTSVRGSSLCGLRTCTRRGGDDGGARRVETRWRGAARGDNRAVVASPGSARTPSHIALQCADASLPPCPSGRRWRRRRHRTCVHRRARWRASPVGNAKTHSTPSHDDGVEHEELPSPPPPPPPPWVSSRRPRHHTRRRLRRAARFVGAFAAAPAQHARALSTIDPCCAGTSWPDLGVRAHLLRSARASRRAAKGARRSMANGEIIGSGSVLRRAWSRPQQGRRGACARWQKKVDGQKS